MRARKYVAYRPERAAEVVEESWNCCIRITAVVVELLIVLCERGLPGIPVDHMGVGSKTVSVTKVRGAQMENIDEVEARIPQHL